jgi:hypothetical protein
MPNEFNGIAPLGASFDAPFDEKLISTKESGTACPSRRKKNWQKYWLSWIREIE